MGKEVISVVRAGKFPVKGQSAPSLGFAGRICGLSATLQFCSFRANAARESTGTEEHSCVPVIPDLQIWAAGGALSPPDPRAEGTE